LSKKKKDRPGPIQTGFRTRFRKRAPQGKPLGGVFEMKIKDGEEGKKTNKKGREKEKLKPVARGKGERSKTTGAAR